MVRVLCTWSALAQDKCLGRDWLAQQPPGPNFLPQLSMKVADQIRLAVPLNGTLMAIHSHKWPQTRLK